MVPPLCGNRHRGADSIAPPGNGESGYDPSGIKSIPKTALVKQKSWQMTVLNAASDRLFRSFATASSPMVNGTQEMTYRQLA